MTNHRVVIAGGGPTGLMLAAELALARVDVAIVERREDQTLAGSRAAGLHSRTLELLDQRGIVDRFLAEGKKSKVASFGANLLSLDDLPSRHNYWLALWQEPTERLLAAWAAELGVTTYRQREVTGFVQDDDGVEVELSEGEPLRAQYLVGCDGGRSAVRKRAGIDFPGWEPSVSCLIAEAEMEDEPAWGVRYGGKGIHALARREEGTRRVRLVSTEPELREGDHPTLDELRASLVAAYGTDFGVRDVSWLSRFTDSTRQAASYRAGRVLIAGDAAHVHFPAGGQGLNLGLQDAVNLGWKLAQVVHGTSPATLLDTYQAESHPVGARVLQLSMALTALGRGDARSSELRALLSELVRMDEARKRYTVQLSALDLHYDLGAGHPLLGRRMPDLDLITASGKTRVFSQLHTARPLLLEFTDANTLDLTPWADRVQRLVARHDGPWELPRLGPVSAPSAVVVRPDGHVAWVGEGSAEGLEEALTTWFGFPSPN